MTNILIPMAGAGSRFKEAGYNISKPVIPLTYRKTGKKFPMVVAAAKDLLLQGSNPNIIFIDRDFHKNEGVETEIKKHIPHSQFITLDHLTDGQASTCLLAKNYINNSEELFIGACDCGMLIDEEVFNKTKTECDAIIFTYRNHDLVLEKPEAHGWVKVEENSKTVAGMSVKIPISDNPLNDQAVTGNFWFKHGSDFIKSTEKMIAENNRINNEFYVDQAMQHAIELGLKVQVFEVTKYFCWGTPKDYENYEKTLKYWLEFSHKEDWV